MIQNNELLLSQLGRESGAATNATTASLVLERRRGARRSAASRPAPTAGERGLGGNRRGG